MTQPFIPFSNDALLEILSLSRQATAIYSTADIVIQSANQAMLDFWGRDQTVIGKPFAEALPELKLQPFPAILYQVWNTGETYTATEVPADLIIQGRIDTQWYDFEYRAVKDAQGQMYCILHTANDVTERVLGRRMNDESKYREDELVEELATSNEELRSVNEELTAINEEIVQSRDELLEMNKAVACSEKLLDEIFTMMPAPVVLLRGRDHVIERANPAIVAFWNVKPEQVMGRGMLEAFPHLAGQAFPAQWKSVLDTGIPVVQVEKMVQFADQQGLMKSSYVDYHYQPVKDEQDHITGVLATVINVTDKVMARQSAEQAEEQLKLAVDSADMGVWSVNVADRDLFVSPRFRSLFGLPAQGTICLDQIIEVVTPAYRHLLSETLEEGLTQAKQSDTEYQIEHTGTGRKHWIRSTGKMVLDADKQPLRYAGLVMDVTERRQDDQRKNDFIGMVSHELKTPLTSLKGYIQLLSRRAEKQADQFAANALSKVEIQVNKMSNMINSFLNISRLESGKIHLNSLDFDLGKLLTEVVEETLLTNDHHQISYVPCHPIFVYADRDKIEHVISNFLSNAIKYSAAGTSIELSCELQGDQVTVSVRDQGMGIRKSDLDKLFDRYYRVETSATHISGFGIGLYLSAEIIQRHHGQIGVKSEEHIGSTFFFTLPVSRSGHQD